MEDQFKKFVDSIRSQERTYLDSGFDPFIAREPVGSSRSGFLPSDESDAYLDEISGSKIATGVTKSRNGALEIDWDEGVITAVFPGGVGYTKYGNVGKDSTGNMAQGMLLHDGTTRRAFWGKKT